MCTRSRTSVQTVLQFHIATVVCEQAHCICKITQQFNTSRERFDDSIKFIKEWLNIFYERFDLVDDTTSKIKNHKDFIENRHDQSVFSILCKKNNLESLSAYECDWAILDHKITWNHNIDSPCHMNCIQLIASNLFHSFEYY